MLTVRYQARPLMALPFVCAAVLGPPFEHKIQDDQMLLGRRGGIVAQLSTYEERGWKEANVKRRQSDSLKMPKARIIYTSE